MIGGDAGARDQRGDRGGREIVGADAGEAAAVAAERGAGEVADEGFVHDGISSLAHRPHGHTRQGRA